MKAWETIGGRVNKRSLDAENQSIAAEKLKRPKNIDEVFFRFLCFRTKGAGGIMFPGCPSIRLFIRPDFRLRDNSRSKL